MLTEEQIRKDVAKLTREAIVGYILDLQKEARIEGWQDGYDEGYGDGTDYYY